MTEQERNFLLEESMRFVKSFHPGKKVVFESGWVVGALDYIAMHAEWRHNRPFNEFQARYLFEGNDIEDRGDMVIVKCHVIVVTPTNDSQPKPAGKE